ncbi:protein REVEILLE 6-like [Lycium ferocissimum]|uniref:protein REVEILLE 6-like n=1 Tax=Lycium ferocissimum TaxID=112874 RepID=UPI002815F4A4|nr:protein REVEILLE 6-like [Lycium ferocissimum]XP_059287612.1 protein REVEILLE 6-like [Lycium ferocissimum]XP_059287613.1 protein REVEILLE 6-like [Lycium ferocissimum]
MTKDHPGLSVGKVTQNRSSSSNESVPKICTTKKTNDQGKEQNKKQRRVMPDFARVCRFIHSVFDPSANAISIIQCYWKYSSPSQSYSSEVR